LQIAVLKEKYGLTKKEEAWDNILESLLIVLLFVEASIVYCFFLWAGNEKLRRLLEGLDPQWEPQKKGNSETKEVKGLKIKPSVQLSPLDILLSKRVKDVHQEASKFKPVHMLQMWKILYNTAFKTLATHSPHAPESLILETFESILAQQPLPNEAMTVKVDVPFINIFKALLRVISLAFSTHSTRVHAQEKKELDDRLRKLVLEVALSIFTCYRAFAVTVPFSMNTIVEPSSVKGRSMPEQEEVRSAVENMLKKSTPHQLKLIREQLEFEIYFANKSSPSGTIAGDWVKDTYAIVKSGIWSNIKQFVALLNNSDAAITILEDIEKNITLSDPSETFVDKDGQAKVPRHSRIGYFAEGGGKNRVIAIVDWVTQSAMLGLHAATQSLLKLVENDGTFSHNESFMRAVKLVLATKFGASIDLSAATDRFPVKFQQRVLYEVLVAIGIEPDRAESMSTLWRKILTDRPFFVAYRDEERKLVSRDDVRYAVGQPMGVLSSWNMLALSHHVVVHIAHIRAGIKKFNYELIGDDLVITQKPAHAEYLGIMSDLGVEVSPIKTHISTGADQTIEFAKKYLIWGIQVAPLPARTIQTTLAGDTRGVVGLFHYLVENKSSLKFMDIAIYLSQIREEQVNPESLFAAIASCYYKAIMPEASRGLAFDKAMLHRYFGRFLGNKPLDNPILVNGMMGDFGLAYRRPITDADIDSSNYQEAIFKRIKHRISADSFNDLRKLEEKRRFCLYAQRRLIALLEGDMTRQQIILQRFWSLSISQCAGQVDTVWADSEERAIPTSLVESLSHDFRKRQWPYPSAAWFNKMRKAGVSANLVQDENIEEVGDE
jgi:hypothetical protein